MNQTTKDSRLGYASKILDIAVSVLAVLVGIAFIASACHIYYTGGQNPYTRERVGEYLAYLLWPSLTLVAVIVASFVLHVVKGSKEEVEAYKDADYVLMRTEKRIPTLMFDKETRAAISKEKTLRIIYLCAGAIVAVAALVFAAVIALDSSQYKNEQLTSEVVGALMFVIPLTLIAIGALAASSYLCNKSASRVLDIRWGAMYDKEFANDYELHVSFIAKIRAFFRKHEKTIKQAWTTSLKVGKIVLGILLAAATVLLLVIGLLGGGMADVLAKAVKICTECIGLG